MFPESPGVEMKTAREMMILMLVLSKRESFLIQLVNGLGKTSTLRMRTYMKLKVHIGSKNFSK